jgi:predicted transcriptional regulator
LNLTWLFHEYQRNLLQVLFDNPGNPLHISELARRANIDSGNAKRYLEKFATQNIVNLDKHSKMTFVTPDLDNPVTSKIFELFELSRMRSFFESNEVYGKVLPRVATALLEEIDGIRMINLIRPRSHNGDDPLSMVLVIVVTNGYHEEDPAITADKVCRKNGLPLSLQPLIIRSQDFKDGWQKHETFYTDLWHERVVLYGESYLWRMVADQGVPEVGRK